MPIRNPALAVAISAVLAGCVATPPEPERRTELPEAYNTLTSRYVYVPPYTQQGTYATHTYNWYYGAGKGLTRYAAGGRVYDERYWQERYASLPQSHRDAMDSLPLARFNFEFDSIALTPDSQRQLASFLEGESLSGSVLVVGYTDHIGPESYNVPLSQRRADAIAQRLRQAWPNVRFLTEGNGTYPKLVNDTTDAARAANRRVEIFHLEADQ
ncbi:OmpA family protein [Halomonas faecis]|uniref:OmpA family protein n=1 Tax=Halomonas faecis TaxID=1562110 RepID=UPI0013D28CAD|nr:OmpA family protein [Halomonas faecis]